MPIGNADDAIPQANDGRIAQRLHRRLIVGMLRPENGRLAGGNSLSNVADDVGRAIENNGQRLARRKDFDRNVLVTHALHAVNIARLGRARQRGHALAAAGQCHRQVAERGLRAAQRSRERRADVVVPANAIEKDKVHLSLVICPLSVAGGQGPAASGHRVILPRLKGAEQREQLRGESRRVEKR